MWGPLPAWGGGPGGVQNRAGENWAFPPTPQHHLACGCCAPFGLSLHSPKKTHHGGIPFDLNLALEALDAQRELRNHLV